jgi:hypothetical protein
MPYIPDHPVFTTPDDETVIWRYLNLPKFLDMLDRQALWFTQTESLPDPFEGVPADVILEEERTVSEAIRNMMIESGVHPDLAQRLRREPSAAMWRRITYVNCWHMNVYESTAMWHAYSQDGLAIRSSVQRLKDSFRGHPTNIYIGKVIYRDQRDPKSAEPHENQLHPAIRKLMSYQHERELRVLTTHIPIPFPWPVDPTKFDRGINIRPVNLDSLIESVYVAPGCTRWTYELVEKIMNRYGFKNRLWPSALDERPDLT